jgi:hypothetical protein
LKPACAIAYLKPATRNRFHAKPKRPPGENPKYRGVKFPPGDFHTLRDLLAAMKKKFVLSINGRP